MGPQILACDLARLGTPSVRLGGIHILRDLRAIESAERLRPSFAAYSVLFCNFGAPTPTVYR
jgi:hypothetical protein